MRQPTNFLLIEHFVLDELFSNLICIYLYDTIVNNSRVLLGVDQYDSVICGSIIFHMHIFNYYIMKFCFVILIFCTT